MISIKPGTPAHRALRLIAQNDGDLTSAEVGAHLWPPPKLTGTSDYLAWRASLRLEVTDRTDDKGHRRIAAIRSLSEAERNARASRLVRRLAEAGLVESRGAPVLASWFVAKWEERTARILTDWRPLGYPMALDQDRARDEALAALLDRPDGSTSIRVRLVSAVADSPTSTADVTGKRPSGQVCRVWSALCDEGIVIPPARRWLTAKGWAVLNPSKCGCGPSEDCLRCKFP